jgi:hypothetical protein
MAYEPSVAMSIVEKPFGRECQAKPPGRKEVGAIPSLAERGKYNRHEARRTFFIKHSMRWILLAAFLFVSAANALAQDPVATPQTLDAVLLLPAQLDFRDASLKDVASQLSRRYGINVLLAERDLAYADISPDKKLTRKVNSETLGAALTALLAPDELAWTRHGEVLFIASQHGASEDRITHIYRVAKDKSAKEFSKRLVKEYRPEDWRQGLPQFGAWPQEEEREVPPPDNDQRHGSIALYGPALVIDHTHADHFAIQQKYRGELVLFPADDSALLPEALRKRKDFDFIDAKLSDVVTWLGKETGLHIYLHEQALEEEDIDKDLKLNLRLKNVSVATALDLLLRDHELAWGYTYGTLRITTAVEDHEPETAMCVIDSRGLFLEDRDFDSLFDLLHSTTPQWDERSGGHQNFVPVEPHFILCKVPYHCQREAARIADELRAALKKPRGGE